MSGYIPSTADNDIQQALRELWAAVDSLREGDLNFHLARRIVNVLPGVGPDDVVVLRQLTEGVATTEAAETTTEAEETSSGDSFSGDIHTDYSEYVEQSSAPSTPASDRVRLFALDFSGATKLFTKDQSGVVRTVGPVVKYSTSTYTRNNTTAVTEASELNIRMGASEVWCIAWFLHGNSNATADIKIQVNGPTGAAGTFAVVNPQGSVSGAWTAALGSPVNVATVSEYGMVVHVTVTNGSTVGNAALNFAQVTATGVNTTVLPGSFVVGHRVA